MYEPPAGTETSGLDDAMLRVKPLRFACGAVSRWWCIRGRSCEYMKAGGGLMQMSRWRLLTIYPAVKAAASVRSDVRSQRGKTLPLMLVCIER